MEVKNLLHDIPPSHGEWFETILKSDAVTIERIVSRGDTTPWLVQEWEEWVLLFAGAARLSIGNRQVGLGPGDFLMIPGGMRHRVLWTDPACETIWLAVHLRQGKPVSRTSHEVWRLDDNGGEFFVSAYADREDAEREATRLSSMGHRQTYDVVTVFKYELEREENDPWDG